MVFSSLEFVIGFMPLFFLCYYLVKDKYKNIILFIGSLAFYFYGTLSAPYHFILFIITLILDFYGAKIMDKKHRYNKCILAILIIIHVLTLGVFKYGSFVVNQITSDYVLEVLLPIGISFYTFQGISYLVDVYKGKCQAEESLLRYVVYISMFEQLIAGPIVTYDQVKDDLDKRHVSIKQAKHGLQVFIFGLGLKVLLANPISHVFMQALNIGIDSISTIFAWLAIIAYSFQIYFDFFGYSLMALGLGEMLGFKLPLNFNHPYISKSMTEFWRRWHVTLGSWFREYVYIPLGGNRKGVVRNIFNLLVVWLLTGMWHGAGYNFILWGILLFVIIVIEKYVLKDFLKQHPVIAHLYMIILIPLSWLVFALDDISLLPVFLSRLFPLGVSAQGIIPYDYLPYLKDYGLFFVIGLLFSTLLPYKLLKKIKQEKLINLMLIIILGLCLYCMYRGFNDPFLYFRF